jgi:hypothetical protein
MITRERIAKALENAFKNFYHADDPATLADALHHWTGFGCCGHLVAAAITRAVDILSGRIDLAWYHDDWSFNAPDEEPNLMSSCALKRWTTPSQRSVTSYRCLASPWKTILQGGDAR